MPELYAMIVLFYAFLALMTLFAGKAFHTAFFEKKSWFGPTIGE